MANILQQWARAGYTPAQVQSWAYAAALMNPNIGPQMQALLNRYGLSGLTNWAAEAIIQNKSQEQIVLELFDQPAFKTRFPAIHKRRDANLPPLSVDEYLSYEQTASSLGSTWGLTLSKSEVDDLLIYDVSPQELEQRFIIAAEAVYTSPAEVREQLQRLHGISTGNLMRYWMDPKKELGDLQNQFRMGQIAGAAVRSGYGEIAKTSAQRLTETGLEPGEALSGFGELATMAGIFSPTDRTEAFLTESQQVELLAGNVDIRRQVEQRVGRRLAHFAGRSGFMTGAEGFTTAAAQG